jgi:hypothetical protein
LKLKHSGSSVLPAEPVKQVHAELCHRPQLVSRRMIELETVIGQNGMDAIRYGFDCGIQERHVTLQISGSCSKAC